MRRTISILIFLASFGFSGCLEIYYDVVVHPNGTFTLRQTTGFGDSYFAMIYDFARTLRHDSISLNKRAFLDSCHLALHLVHQVEMDSLTSVHRMVGTHGITSLRMYDTTVDSMIFFTTAIEVSNADSLPAAFSLLADRHDYALLGKAQVSSKMTLSVTNTPNSLVLSYHSRHLSSSDSLEMVGLLLDCLPDDVGLHLRVFANALGPTENKRTKRIAGGEDFSFGLKDIKEFKELQDVTFTILKQR
ncbi:MAG: hypothetical protein Q8922_14315 [Bacteroidota bacterium]|nr:hypothetical protein [Bacteroidota bacterium]MDP4234333.1 hypothetical protein [Bacteroidota bacterium]MDP4289092.1 hypothetical protein [Bacteroidota bacterium]